MRQARPDNLREIGLRWLANERFAIGWKGHLYLPGYKAGEDSVAARAVMLGTSALALPRLTRLEACLITRVVATRNQPQEGFPMMALGFRRPAPIRA